MRLKTHAKDCEYGPGKLIETTNLFPTVNAEMFNTLLPPLLQYPMNLQSYFLQGLLFEDVPIKRRTGQNAVSDLV